MEGKKRKRGKKEERRGSGNRGEEIRELAINSIFSQNKTKDLYLDLHLVLPSLIIIIIKNKYY